MHQPQGMQADLIGEFRRHLNAKNYEFTEHNNGFHFRVKKNGVTYNVYPTTGKVLSNDNKAKLNTKLNEFFS